MQWASESSSGRLALEPVPPGYVAAPDPYAEKGGSGGHRRSRTPMGSAVSAVSPDLPLLRDTWRLRTYPQAGNRSGAVGLMREEPGPWGLAIPSFPRSYG